MLTKKLPGLRYSFLRFLAQMNSLVKKFHRNQNI